jgi:GTP cyclohydrolase I
MAEKFNVTVAMLNVLASKAAKAIAEKFGQRPIVAYAVPRGGIPAALAIGRHIQLSLTESPNAADVIIDDLIDTGATSKRFPGKPFFALIDKRTEYQSTWIVWPWEGTAEGGIEDNIRRILQFVGEDPARGGLIETPKRVAKAWEFWCSGYDLDPADVLKTFEDGAEGQDEMIVVRDIPFYTHCEHHLAPFFGTATIGYIPNGKIVGLSKLSRVLKIFARRLQVQERLTSQVADAIEQHLGAIGVGVVVTARHLCMESRGICEQGSETVTSALRGVIKSEPSARSEFLRLAQG